MAKKTKVKWYKGKHDKVTKQQGQAFLSLAVQAAETVIARSKAVIEIAPLCGDGTHAVIVKRVQPWRSAAKRQKSLASREKALATLKSDILKAGYTIK